MEPGVTITMDGDAICERCGKVIWKVPNKKKWIESGRKPTSQTLLMAAHLTHLKQEHNY